MYGTGLPFSVATDSVLQLKSVSSDVLSFSANIALSGYRNSFRYLDLNPQRNLALTVNILSDEPAGGWSRIKCALRDEGEALVIEEQAVYGKCALVTPSFSDSEPCLSLGKSYALEIVDSSREFLKSSQKVTMDADSVSVDCELDKSSKIAITLQGEADSEVDVTVVDQAGTSLLVKRLKPNDTFSLDLYDSNALPGSTVVVRCTDAHKTDYERVYDDSTCAIVLEGGEQSATIKLVSAVKTTFKFVLDTEIGDAAADLTQIRCYVYDEDQLVYSLSAEKEQDHAVCWLNGTVQRSELFPGGDYTFRAVDEAKSFETLEKSFEFTHNGSFGIRLAQRAIVSLTVTDKLTQKPLRGTRCEI